MAATARPGESTAAGDSADLAQFGYEQSLHRRLHFFSSFAAAFSYISPATGIFRGWGPRYSPAQRHRAAIVAPRTA